MIVEKVMMPYILACQHHIMHLSCLLVSMIALHIQSGNNLDDGGKSNQFNTFQEEKEFFAACYGAPGKINQYFGTPQAAFTWFYVNNIVNLVLIAIETYDNRKHEQQRVTNGVKVLEQGNRTYRNMFMQLARVILNFYTVVIGQISLLNFFSPYGVCSKWTPAEDKKTGTYVAGSQPTIYKESTKTMTTSWVEI